ARVLRTAGDAYRFALRTGAVVELPDGPERLLRAHTGAQHLARPEPVAGLDRVAPPDLPPVEAYFLREAIEASLDGEVRLVRSEPPHGPARHVVRVDGSGLDVDVGDLVDAARMPRRPLQDRLAHAGVRPGVPDHPRLHRDQTAVLVAPRPVLHGDGVALRVEPQALLP